MNATSLRLLMHAVTLTLPVVGLCSSLCLLAIASSVESAGLAAVLTIVNGSMVSWNLFGGDDEDELA